MRFYVFPEFSRFITFRLELIAIDTLLLLNYVFIVLLVAFTSNFKPHPFTSHYRRLAAASNMGLSLNKPL